MGMYLTSAEIKLHEWRMILRKAQATLQQHRAKKKGRSPADIAVAEGAVKWAIRRVASAQDTVESERARRARIVDSLLSVPEHQEV